MLTSCFFFLSFFFPPLWFIFQVSAELNIVRATWTYNSNQRIWGLQYLFQYSHSHLKQADLQWWREQFLPCQRIYVLTQPGLYIFLTKTINLDSFWKTWKSSTVKQMTYIKCLDTWTALLRRQARQMCLQVHCLSSWAIQYSSLCRLVLWLDNCFL